MTATRRASRVRTTVLGTAVFLALALSGCSADVSADAPVDGAQAPAPGTAQYTSDTGAITMDVPEEWDDITAVLRDAVVVPGQTLEGAWLLSRTLFVDGSTLFVITVDAAGVTTAEFVEAGSSLWVQGWGGLQKVVKRESFTGAGGIAYERVDYAMEPSNYTVLLGAVVDGVGIQIVLTLIDDDALLDVALDAVRSLTLR